MDTARLTDERLRFGLNGDQPSRERMCLAILALDRNYSDAQPRRPEGGPDGGRDIQCRRGPDLCFGAVGFRNRVSDSPDDKRATKEKFRADLESALAQQPDLKAFVFFTNVDLTPGEVEELRVFARERNVSFVDIYWRERIRDVLDGVEGLAVRFQYLSIVLSEAEQATFFGRFGKDLERLVLGRFEQLEQKVDRVRFEQWQAGRIHKLGLQLAFPRLERSRLDEKDHFRFCLELHGRHRDRRDERTILFGGRDDFYQGGEGKWYFGTKGFFWRSWVGKIEDSWVRRVGPRADSGHVGEIETEVLWRPTSDILAAEFRDLSPVLHYSENLHGRIARVRFTIDSYIFIDERIPTDGQRWMFDPPAWPDTLTAEEVAIGWRSMHLWPLSFSYPPKTTDSE